MGNKHEEERLPSFVQRFNINVAVTDAQKHFVNRVQNMIFDRYLMLVTEDHRQQFLWPLANDLGRVYHSSEQAFTFYTGGDFLNTLRALETAYRVLPKGPQQVLAAYIGEVLQASEVDLGVQWRDGCFWPSGAKLLD